MTDFTEKVIKLDLDLQTPLAQFTLFFNLSLYSWIEGGLLLIWGRKKVIDPPFSSPPTRHWMFTVRERKEFIMRCLGDNVWLLSFARHLVAESK